MKNKTSVLALLTLDGWAYFLQLLVYRMAVLRKLQRRQMPYRRPRHRSFYWGQRYTKGEIVLRSRAA